MEIIKNKEKFNQWIQDVTFEDFKKYLTLINGIVRDRTIKKRDMDGQNVFIGRSDLDGAIIYDYLPPKSELKEGLLLSMFNSLKKLSNYEDRGF